MIVLERERIRYRPRQTNRVSYRPSSLAPRNITKCMYAGAIAAQPVTVVTIVDFTSNGTWTCPAGVFFVLVECVGGGGGGRGGINLGRGGGGGREGDYASSFVAVTPGNNYAIVIGGAGHGTLYNATTNGTSGAATKFAATVVVAAGGAVASAGIGGSTAIGGPSVGTTIITGVSGGSSVNSVSSDGAAGGGSGYPLGGAGGLGGVAGDILGKVGGNYGAGGGGGRGNVAGANGGDGTQGICRLTFDLPI